MIFILFSIINNEQRGGGGAGALPDFFFFLFFPVSRTRAGLATVRSSFFGLATNTLNVRNDNNNNDSSGLAKL